MSSELNYALHGHDLQMVEILLDPDQSVIAEVGALNHMGRHVAFETRLGDGSETGESTFGKLLSIGSRVLSGENVFVGHFTNHGQQNASVAFSAPSPGRIIAINLTDHGETILCQKDSFLAAERGTHISVELTKKINSGFFSGSGFILQKITGTGIVFLNAGGTILERQLDDDELTIETGSLVAFTEDLDYDVKLVKAKSALFGGEGLFMTTLKGSGTVWLQSHTISKFVDRIAHLLPPSSK